jgi:hypothetical protein
MNKPYQGLTKNSEVPFDIVSNPSLQPKKALSAGFSARVGLAANSLAAARRFHLFRCFPQDQLRIHGLNVCFL